MHNLLNFGVANLPMVSNAKTRSISAENPDGSKGGGGKAAPAADGPGSRLGPGWKSQPFLKLPPNDEIVLADVAGPGVIQHIWMTTRTDANRNCLLRMYWDNERTPSVEVPLGDFFANGHALRYNVNSMMVCVNPQGAFNS
ncbi:DUF2961 domain-containing protein, partial [bacterium]|nr:DUF2961 domain-containing protein [bacterium]